MTRPLTREELDKYAGLVLATQLATEQGREATHRAIDEYQTFTETLGGDFEAFVAVIEMARRAIDLESELAQLRRGVVANAGRLSSRKLPRWAHVRDAVGVGSTSAREMCRAAGFDPEELVGREPMEKAEGEFRSDPCPGCGKVSRAETAGCDYCDYEDK